MNDDGLSLWLQQQLKPIAQSLANLSPGAFHWLSLLVSLTIGIVLYLSAEKPVVAILAAMLLGIKLMLDALGRAVACQDYKSKIADQLISRLCDRISDLAIFFGLAFWINIRVYLVLFAIVSMLIVSYVGELGRSLGAKDVSGGLLCQTNRTVLMMLFSIVYACRPEGVIMGFSVFEVMFILFIPLASITLLQRLESILSQLGRAGKN